MNRLYDALEICLQKLENGVSLENVLALYPDLANDLRPILQASIKARMSMATSAPSPEVIRRGRARLLQRASEMREAKAPSRKRVIPVFQRLALSFGLTAAFLLSGTGLVGVSASALPGEKLYPVKRTWEDLRLFFTFDKNTRAVVESQYEIERLHEVSELIAEGRHELIQFVGVFMRLNDMVYISSVPVLLPVNLQEPENGAAVIVTGRTNAQGFVELESLELLPDGVFVPLGQPMELESNQESHDASNTEPTPATNSNEASGGPGSESSDNSNETVVVSKPEHRDDFEVEGIVESLTGTTLVINGTTVYLEGATIDGELKVGIKVEIKGYYAEDGRFIVTEIEVKQSSGAKENSNSDSNDDNSDSHNDNDSNHNDNDHNDNDSDHNDNNNDHNDNDHNDNDNDNHNDNDGHGD